MTEYEHATIHRTAMSRRLVFFAVAALPAGALLCWISLVRLGWRRHNADADDFEFLHLDWVFSPALSSWSAHMVHLAGLLLGVALTLLSLALLARAVWARWAPSRPPSS